MEGPGPGSPVRLRAGTAGRCQSTAHRQASIPHESPAGRRGKKHEGGPRPRGGCPAGSPSGVCPHLGPGAGLVRVGRQMGGRGDGGGERSWPGCVCVCMEASMCLRTRTWPLCVYLPVYIGKHICVSAKKEPVYVCRCVCVCTWRDGARPRDSESRPSAV